MIDNSIRNGNVSSSEIVALTKKGSRPMTPEELIEHKKTFPESKKKNIEDGLADTAFNYILECNMERKLGASLTEDIQVRAFTWGLLMEPFLHDQLGTDYKLDSQTTIVHPTIPYWVGSPDGKRFDQGGTTVEMKNPLTKKSFCQLVDPLYDGLEGIEAMNAIRFGYKDSAGFEHPSHKDGEKFYWQCGSNSILQETKYVELIIHMPYYSQLNEVKLLADGNPAAYWISMAGENELPYLKDDGFYKNINKIRFEFPQEDKDFLTSCVKEAGNYLIHF